MCALLTALQNGHVVQLYNRLRKESDEQLCAYYGGIGTRRPSSKGIYRVTQYISNKWDMAVARCVSCSTSLVSALSPAFVAAAVHYAAEYTAVIRCPCTRVLLLSV